MKYQNAEGRVIEATEHAYEVCYRELGFVPVGDAEFSKKPNTDMTLGEDSEGKEEAKGEVKDESAGEDVEESEAAPRAKRGRK